MTTWEELAEQHPENIQLQMIVKQRAGEDMGTHYHSVPDPTSPTGYREVEVSESSNLSQSRISSQEWGQLPAGQTQTGYTPPPPVVPPLQDVTEIPISELEKSRELGGYIIQPERPEPIHETIPTEVLEEQWEKERMRRKLAEVWRPYETSVEAEPTIGRFFVKTAEVLGIPQMKYMGQVPEVRKKTLEYAEKYPEDILTGAIKGGALFPILFGHDVAEKVEKGQYVDIASSVIGLAGLGGVTGKLIGGVSKISPIKTRLEISRMTEGMTKIQKETFIQQMGIYGKLKGVRPLVKEIKMPSRFKGQERLWEITKEYAKDTKMTVGGSVAGETQVYGIQRTKIDFDAFMKGPAKAGKELFRKWKKAGVKDIGLRISHKGELMETGKLLIGGKKAVEFHKIDWLKRFPFAEKPVKTPSGIEVIKGPEQLARKIYGSAMGRPKDIPDVPVIAKSLGITKEHFPQRTPFPVLSKSMKGEIGLGLSKELDAMIGVLSKKTGKGPVSKPYKPYPSHKPPPIIPKYPPYKPAPKKPLYVPYKTPPKPPAYPPYKPPPKPPPIIPPYKPPPPKTPKYPPYKPAPKPVIYPPYEPPYKAPPLTPRPPPRKPPGIPSMIRIPSRTRGIRKRLLGGKPPKKSYSPSLGGLVSGKTIKKTPKGLLTGLGIRKPVKGKRKRSLI